MYRAIVKLRRNNWTEAFPPKIVVRANQSFKYCSISKSSCNLTFFSHSALSSRIYLTNFEDIFRSYSTEGSLDKLKFEEICSDTLESLTEHFEEIIESVPHLENADVQYSDGVLTVKLGKFGTYVINRQSPNLQIWLSSPTSGPKRYDFINGVWVYKHDQTTLHTLLQKEITNIIKRDATFLDCHFAKKVC